jgi:hypothetical protein
MKFDDINGNGVKDSGEPGLEDWTIRLLKEGTEIANTKTVDDGGYSLQTLFPAATPSKRMPSPVGFKPGLPHQGYIP